MNSHIKNVIFDLDGTLIDSSGDIIECLEEAYRKTGIATPEITKNCIGPPVRDIIKTITPGLEEEKIEEVVRNFRFLYDNSTFSKTGVYENIHGLLRKLKEDHRALFLVTNKPLLATRRVLKILKLDYFMDLITFDMDGSEKARMVSALIRKWNLAKPQTIVVGDSIADIAGAKENDIQSVGVLWGYSDKDSITAAQSDFIAADVKSLRNILFQVKEGKK